MSPNETPAEPTPHELLLKRVTEVIATAERRNELCKGRCQDCRWVDRRGHGSAKCHHPVVMLEGFDPRVGPQAKSTGGQREASGLCGPEGHLWEPIGWRLLALRYRTEGWAIVQCALGGMVGTLVVIFLGMFLGGAFS